MESATTLLPFRKIHGRRIAEPPSSFFVTEDGLCFKIAEGPPYIAPRPVKISAWTMILLVRSGSVGLQVGHR
jgi:hypothetical protein